MLILLISLAIATDHIFVVAGPSGVGKTTLINFFSNGPLIPVPESKFSQTLGTNTYRFYSDYLSANTTFIDTQGFIDTENRDNATVIALKNMMTNELWSNPRSEFIFLILFAASDSRIQVQRTFEGLREAFSDEFFKSIIIVLTKVEIARLMNDQNVQMTKEYVGNEAIKFFKTHNINLTEQNFPIVALETKRYEVNSTDYVKQKADFIDAIEQAEPYASSFMFDAYIKILDALEKCIEKEIEIDVDIMDIMKGSIACSKHTVISHKLQKVLNEHLSRSYNVNSVIEELKSSLDMEELMEYNSFLGNHKLSVKQELIKLNELITRRRTTSKFSDLHLNKYASLVKGFLSKIGTSISELLHVECNSLYDKAFEKCENIVMPKHLSLIHI